MKYRILSESNLFSLEQQINSWAEDGWRLVTFCIRPPMYTAAMMHAEGNEE